MDPIPNLIEAARAGNINGLYEAIKENPAVLKEIDEIPFFHTPLHEAASAGQTHFATVMIDLAPSFATKLNPDCLSPLHLAVINNHYDTVKMLVSFNRELVRVKGKDRLTPLHCAAESDDKIQCLIGLLLACPASIEDLTIRDETALDIAMKKKKSSAEAFNILYEWVSRAGDHKQLLQKKDAEGNSAEAYHEKQPRKDRKSLQAVKAEQPSSADDDTENLYDYLNTPELCYESKVRKCLQFMLWTRRDLTMEMRHVVLVVAVLIATASFQAIFNPPGGEGGGLASQNNNSSSQHSDNSFVYTIFNETTYNFVKLARDDDFFSGWFFLNTIAFTASVGVIIIVLQWRSYTIILHLSLFFMIACYCSALNRVLSPLVAFIYYIGSSVYVFWLYYFKILFWSIESRQPKLLAKLLLSPYLKQKFHCLHQMGALTLK